MPPELGSAIDALVDARLVARTGDEVDVVHEVVFRAWPQMVTWLEEARADLTLERDLRVPRRAAGMQRDDPTTRCSAAAACRRRPTGRRGAVTSRR